MIRNRILYISLIISTICLGLASRRFSASLPVFNKLYVGDALWALMVFFMIGFVFVRKSSIWVVICALVFSYCIEFSQLYHDAWIDAIRATRIGALVLGFGFLWADLVCYGVGVGIGYALEKYAFKKYITP